ncbi:hypothetical protein [Afipia sp. 1NLS2]|uniref:hypothetical protein n=1 Tax=Afipia sp. 1NLS2 TaxID=666684 RepID=UPI0001DA159C|nr:hypothetical protein [Afipia sp. 1NLS2]EFI53586.1 hypothetical protein AfiDRAFT_1573 [Afipia sp. 1NLS2]
MIDLTRRLLLQLSLAGTASACSDKTSARSPLEELWMQRIPLLRERLAIEGRSDLNSTPARTAETGLSWDAIKLAMDAIEQQIWTLPPDPDTIAARLLIDYENYSLETATEIGSPRDSLRWIADAYLRVHFKDLSSFIFRST